MFTKIHNLMILTTCATMVSAAAACDGVDEFGEPAAEEAVLTSDEAELQALEIEDAVEDAEHDGLGGSDDNFGMKGNASGAQFDGPSGINSNSEGDVLQSGSTKMQLYTTGTIKTPGVYVNNSTLKVTVEQVSIFADLSITVYRDDPIFNNKVGFMSCKAKVPKCTGTWAVDSKYYYFAKVSRSSATVGTTFNITFVWPG